MCNKCNTKTINYYNNYTNKLNKKDQRSMYILFGCNDAANLLGTILNGSYNFNTNTSSVSGYNNSFLDVIGGFVKDLFKSDKPVATNKPKTETKTVENEKKELTDDEIKTKIKDLLGSEELGEQKITDLTDGILGCLVERYKLYKNDPVAEPSDEFLRLRLANYLRGELNLAKLAEWQKRENDLKKNGLTVKPESLSKMSLVGEKIDLKNKDNALSITKLEKTASEHIACADKNNDKSVDLLEFFRNDLITYYLVYENLKLDQAIGEADKKLEELNIKTSEDLKNYEEKINFESPDDIQITLVNSKVQFIKLNQDQKDDCLDIHEIMAYYSAIANTCTNDNCIDEGDYSKFNGLIEKELMNGGKDESAIAAKLKINYDGIKKYYVSNQKKY